MAARQSVRSLRSFQACFVLAGMCLMLFPAVSGAANPFAGNIKAIDSTDPAATAKIMHLGYAGILAGKPGDAVYVGDTVKTAAGVRVQIELSDNSIITVAPNSAVQMKGHVMDREQGRRSSVLKSLKGTVRFVISRFFKPHAAGAEMKWKDSNVVIEAQNAVAGVRGTDLVVTTTEKETEVAVFEGAVGLRHSSPSNKNDVMIGADQFSMVRKDGGPDQPQALSAERKAALENATTLVNPRTKAEASNGTEPKKNASNGKGVAKDLAAGIPLADVLDRAVESGMPLGDVIGAAINAGVNPSTLVYTAVTEGYSPKEVVTAAVENGAPLSAVVAAAMAAGADKNLVISGAVDAGVPPAAIATAMSNGASSNGPVYGTPLPMDGVPSPIIPAPPVSIGGGGGAAPSTKRASPYRP
ncbi:MAG: FecR family protein [Nitrospirota bacterium]